MRKLRIARRCWSRGHYGRPLRRKNFCHSYYVRSFERRSFRNSEAVYIDITICATHKSTREFERRNWRGFNFVSVPTQRQSLPGKEVNNCLFDSVLPDLFLVTSWRSQILFYRFRVASIFTKGDKCISDWATFDWVSRCRKCLGRYPRPRKFVHTFRSAEEKKKCASDRVYLFAFLCLHNLTCKCSFRITNKPTAGGSPSYFVFNKGVERQNNNNNWTEVTIATPRYSDLKAALKYADLNNDNVDLKMSKEMRQN